MPLVLVCDKEKTIYIIHSPESWFTATELENKLKEQYPSYNIVRLNRGVEEEDKLADKIIEEAEEKGCQIR